MKKLWWKHGVIYHIYIRSFYDSNGDGIGDLGGILEKLDYIEEMGFSGIWISPFFKSPMADYGYDISSYKAIDPQYGTMDDFKKLSAECKKRNIHIIMDIALNHTSDQHPWFLKSRSGLDNSKRDWYIWKKGKANGPPNNWMNGLFESAWTLDPKTDEYYLHSFLKAQPDLNWRNKKVQNAFVKIFQFWMDLGVDGFRLDMINWLIKDSEFRDNPTPYLKLKIFQKQIYNKNQTRISSVLKLIRKTVDQSPENVTIGEVFTLPPGDPKLSAFFLGNGKNYLHMAFDFSLMYRLWNVKSIYKTVALWIDSIPEKAWPAHVLSNHDQKRYLTRLCRGRHALKKAKILTTLLLTIPGTPFIYYGDEIGMESRAMRKKDLVDPLGKKFWPLYMGRDISRKPMKWNGQKNAGFSVNKKTWLTVDEDYPSHNLETQKKDPDSLWNFYKALIQLRNNEAAIQGPKWEVIEKGKSGVICYFRHSQSKKNPSFLVLLNFKNKAITIELSKNFHSAAWEKILSSCPLPAHRNSRHSIKVNPFEAVIFRKKELSEKKTKNKF